MRRCGTPAVGSGLVRVLLICAAAGATAVPAALALPTSADPKKLILQKSDLPSGAQKLPFSISKSGTLTVPKVGRVRHAEALYRVGSKYAGSVAFVFGSASIAKQAFNRSTSSKQGKFKTIHVAKLGDQQIARGLFSTGLSSVVIIVRDDGIVWELAYTVVGKTSRSTAIAQALSLARKQNAHVD